MDRESARGSAYVYNAIAYAHGWDAYCDPMLNFHWPAFDTLLEIWRGAQNGQGLPPRTALTARILKDYLRCMTIYERGFDSSGTRYYRVRLMGTVFAQVYGDLTGRVIEQTFSGEKLARFHAALDQTLKSPAPLRIIAAADVPDKSFLCAEYFLGPLADAAGEPAMVLSCAHFSGEKPWVEYSTEAKKRVAHREPV